MKLSPSPIEKPLDMHRFGPSIRIALLALILAITGVGCGRKNVVTGTVSLGTKKLATGSVVMVQEDTLRLFQGQIEPDGTYTIEGVPYGELKIAVHSANPNVKVEVKRKADPELFRGKEKQVSQAPPVVGWFPIPEQYGDHTKSNLSIVIEQPMTVHNIELKQ
jgi:hypothetical protein